LCACKQSSQSSDAAISTPPTQTTPPLIEFSYLYLNLSATSRRTTRSMTTDAPRQAALNTTEILENILTYLPNRAVFGVQRVCRQWRNTIASSPTIQEKLFLRLRHRTPETWMLTNPVSFYQYYYQEGNFDIQKHERKFRVAKAAEVELAKTEMDEEMPHGGERDSCSCQ
jgi:hypothetical protein